MSPAYFVCTALELVAVASLLITGGWKLSRFFLLYLVAVVVPDIVFGVWPATYVWRWWVVKETAQSTFKWGLALELLGLAFAALPAARSIADRCLILILVGTIARLAVGASLTNVTWWIPIVNDGTVVAFAMILGLATWYRVPLHPLHHAILGGITVYLVGDSVATHLLGGSGWTPLFRDLHAAAYGGVLLYWLRAVWSHEEVPSTAPLRELRPWA